MMALSAVVHHDVSVEPDFYQGWTKEVEVGDYHETVLGPNIDHATVYAKDCAGGDRGTCGECAISFTATEDAWDFMQDMNITTTAFCGLAKVHGGFADEMRGFTRNTTLWGRAMNFLRDRCTGTTYATGTSLGGAVASLFAFCANRVQTTDDNLDAPHFADLPAIRLVTFGAPAVVKNEELYSGEPGRCFDGLRVAILDKNDYIMDKTWMHDALTHVVALLGQMTTDSSALLAESVGLELAILADVADDDNQGLADFKLRFVTTYMEPVLAETANFLIAFIGGKLDSSKLWALSGVVFWLSLNMNDPNDSFKFEFDATPALLEGFGFRHANVQLKGIGHPKGTQTSDNLWSTHGCAEEITTKAPYAEFMHVFWATLGSLGMQGVQKLLSAEDVTTPFPPNADYSAGFPNHHLCCYFQGLTGGTDADCGMNPDTQVPYSCDAPSWR